MKCRIDYDLPSVPARLKEWGHPYADEWDLAALSQCLVARIVHPNEHGQDAIVGYVWYHWQNQWAKRIEMHVCINPQHHRRWCTPTVYRDIIQLARLCDAQYLIARDNDNTRQATILRKAQFEHHPAANWWALPIPENS